MLRKGSLTGLAAVATFGGDGGSACPASRGMVPLRLGPFWMPRSPPQACRAMLRRAHNRDSSSIFHGQIQLEVSAYSRQQAFVGAPAITVTTSIPRYGQRRDLNARPRSPAQRCGFQSGSYRTWFALGRANQTSPRNILSEITVSFDCAAVFPGASNRVPTPIPPQSSPRFQIRVRPLIARVHPCSPSIRPVNRPGNHPEIAGDDQGPS